jgi:WD40 repeat protein
MLRTARASVDGYCYHVINRGNGRADDIRGLAVSPGGRCGVSARFDQTLRLWYVAAGQEVLTLRGHTGYVESVPFSPHGNFIASASDNGIVELWDGGPRGRGPECAPGP